MLPDVKLTNSNYWFLWICEFTSLFGKTRSGKGPFKWPSSGKACVWNKRGFLLWKAN